MGWAHRAPRGTGGRADTLNKTIVEIKIAAPADLHHGPYLLQSFGRHGCFLSAIMRLVYSYRRRSFKKFPWSGPFRGRWRDERFLTAEIYRGVGKLTIAHATMRLKSSRDTCTSTASFSRLLSQPMRRCDRKAPGIFLHPHLFSRLLLDNNTSKSDVEAIHNPYPYNHEACWHHFRCNRRAVFSG